MLLERISKWMEAYDQNGYLNGSILIACNEKIIMSKGFGIANWEHKVPNTSTTKFPIGSITKGFTAMSIFQLHEKKNLNINDFVGKYLPYYPNGDRISIFHCLTNTSGIPNYTSFPDFWSHKMRLPSTLEKLINSFKASELDFEPGSRFGYSNSGYALLTAIIETVSGMPYSSYIKDQICLPLGMYNTGCDDGVKLVSDIASGYSFYEEPIRPAYTDMSFPLGAYGLYSTTEDLFIWDKALTTSRLLNNELMDRMFTPYLGSYACGWMVSEVWDRKCVNHFGDISGYFCDFLRFVDEQVTVIFLSNMSVVPVTHLSREIAKTIFEGNVSLPLPAEPIQLNNKDSKVGKYMIENGTNKVLDVSLKNNELYLTVPKMYDVLYKFKLVPVSHNSTKTTFITEMISEQLVFHYAASREIEYVEYTDYLGKRHTLYKISPS
ncbi:serine hydrolase domain-containing protein [Paenibacillus radicis (ex Xue et al. 2023)]|uniref:Beta-lactamase family protein n=1 Tax=Paenibacillus radicis (ex Xue et al. 2023) TaxID=2972489 RepID=A0ABT1YA85_9BACL|nr:serine hydrolase domain-containing protein [Paenibacillus radicis (ex Xue et al. 2023)]MCR8630093.1 beta-lactamase family protein [Paenibacillus radicis (ex Xue et al. 2023)]